MLRGSGCTNQLQITLLSFQPLFTAHYTSQQTFPSETFVFLFVQKVSTRFTSGMAYAVLHGGTLRKYSDYDGFF